MNARRILPTVLAVLAFLGLSLTYETPRVRVMGNAPTSLFQNIHLAFAPIPLRAAPPADAADWNAVRDVTTFARNLVNGINTTIQAFEANGLFNWNVNGSWTGDGSDGNRYKMTINGTGTATGPYGSKPYGYIFEAWTSGGIKILEFYFNKPGTTNAGEVMIVFAGNAAGFTETNANGRLLCQATGAAGSRTMICSLGSGNTGTSYNASPDVIDAVRVSVAEASGNVVQVRGLARTMANVGIGNCTAGNQDYYGIAFIASKDSPHYTTAKQAASNTAPLVSGQICGGAYTNYGFFNTSADTYFAATGPTAPNASYPSTTAVDALFATMTSTATGQTDVTAHAVDAMMSDFANQVDFKLSETMPLL